MNTNPRSNPHCAAIIVAAGRGTRAGGPVPKQYAMLAGLPVLRRTLHPFAQHPGVGKIVVVIHPDDRLIAEDAARGIEISFVDGGETRQESVYNGLKYMENTNPDTVLIHDAARPFVTLDILSRTITAAEQHGGAVAGLPVADTLKQVGDAAAILETVPRDGMWRAQTPQTFRFAPLLAAHRAVQGKALTDDAAVAERAGMTVVMTRGSEDNFKITTPDDLERAERLAMTRHDTLVGQGYDVHAFAPGDHVWLCGVRIAHDQALRGHSDADVALHALTDAVYGALGAGDIGQHFPDTDPQWRGVASDRFLRHAMEMLAARGGRLVNVDLTIICEQPKLAPHRDAMLATLGDLTGLSTDRIGLKATTTEKLGFTGRGEGIAAQAIVSVGLPASP